MERKRNLAFADVNIKTLTDKVDDRIQEQEKAIIDYRNTIDIQNTEFKTTIQNAENQRNDDIKSKELEDIKPIDDNLAKQNYASHNKYYSEVQKAVVDFFVESEEAVQKLQREFDGPNAVIQSESSVQTSLNPFKRLIRWMFFSLRP